MRFLINFENNTPITNTRFNGFNYRISLHFEQRLNSLFTVYFFSFYLHPKSSSSFNAFIMLSIQSKKHICIKVKKQLFL